LDVVPWCNIFKAILVKEHKKLNHTKEEIRLFKYLIYLFLIIISYKLATAIAVPFGVFPKDQMSGLAVMILGPLYLFIFIPIFLAIATILILFSKFFFKRNTLFQKLIDMTENYTTINSFIFWIVLGLLPYISLPFFDITIEKAREAGYINREDYIRKNIAHNKLKNEAYKDKVLNYTKEEALELVKTDGSKLRLLSAEFKKDKEIVYEAVKQNPYDGLKYAHTSFKSDSELVFMAVAKNGSALCMANDDLRKNKKLVLTAIHAIKDATQTFVCADQSFRKDKEVVLAAIQSFPLKALHMAHSSLKKDREVVLASVKLAGFTLSSADASLKKDRELVLVAVKQSGYALDYIDKSLKDDREIVLAALKANGGALRYATDEQKADKEFVLVAVKNDDEFYDALKYADIHLVDDKEIALAAVKNNGLALQHISMRLKHDKEVVSEAIKQNKHAITLVPKSLQKEFK